MPAINSSHAGAYFIVAHPDDECIFFFETIRRMIKARLRVTVILATGRFRSAKETKRRMREFAASCAALGTDGISLGLRDARGSALDQATLRDRLRCVIPARSGLRVYTHNPWGDYGHPHHASLALAVSEVFGDGAYYLAGPLDADQSIALSKHEFQRKRRHMKKHYPSQAFASDWCSRRERFVRLNPKTVSLLTTFSLHTSATGGRAPIFRKIAAKGNAVRSYALAFSQSSSAIPPEIANIPYAAWAPRIRPIWERLQKRLGSNLSFLE